MQSGTLCAAKVSPQPSAVVGHAAARLCSRSLLLSTLHRVARTHSCDDALFLSGDARDVTPDFMSLRKDRSDVSIRRSNLR